MINFLPPIYEDELLYSVVSRYKRRAGIYKKKAISREFYELEQGVISVILPVHLNKFCNQLPITSKIKAEDVLNNNTEYEFYTKFLSYEKCNQIKEYMLRDESPNILMITGLMGSKVKINKYLKYCPLCINEDIKKLGESYWRRKHQYMGVLICEEHKCLLQNSSVQVVDSYREYICADSINKSNIPIYDCKVVELNSKYMKLVNEIIECNEIRLTPEYMKKFYKYKLSTKGYILKGGRINRAKLAKEFKEYYSEDYLIKVDSNFNVEDPNNWVSNFLYTNRNNITLRHLLMLQFLDTSVYEMFQSIKKIEIDYDKKETIYNNPNLKLLRKRKAQWLKIIEQNPDKTRTELMKINPAVCTYIFRYEKEWYFKVTPKKSRGRRGESVDWVKRDNELLESVKEAVSKILYKHGVPERICRASIRRELQSTRSINNKKLVRTNNYIRQNTETNGEYQIRKINWAIDELIKNNKKVTIYSVNMRSGFGGHYKEGIKELITELLIERGLI
ncbi:TnsD family Tn7-like transposition protein [Clostridium butyricum]|uniref:TnsD family Tn7-like transposition protein n=1 Tax=Clostridium butyricum TaxID=1492 RepID=UPI0011DCECB1|nr:TnsD family Tn7-like transposition protein [Clostridium butyricum]